MINPIPIIWIYNIFSLKVMKLTTTAIDILAEVKQGITMLASALVKANWVKSSAKKANIIVKIMNIIINEAFGMAVIRLVTVSKAMNVPAVILNSKPANLFFFRIKMMIEIISTPNTIDAITIKYGKL